MSQEKVVLVNEAGEEVGTMLKMEAHEKGLLHKAISVLIFNDAGEMLLQQRAMSKYHWAGIWSNSCCTHPRENESYSEAAHRRLKEELGFSTPLTESFSFIYKAEDVSSGLTEHELDHVFIGKYNESIPFNIEEVMDVRWISLEDLDIDIKNNPEKYSFWFKVIWKEMKDKSLLETA